MQQNIWQSKVVIRFPDCDPFNHLNNSRYVDYFLNAREDQLLEHTQLHIYNYTKETGFGWVVGQHQIAYMRPAYTMESVIIESLVLHWGEKDILVEFRMWDEKQKVLKSIMWTRFYYYNLATQKSEIHPLELKERFEPLTVPAEHDETFEERCEFLRRKLI